MGFLVSLFSTMIINNVVLTGYKGLCSYLGISKKTSSAVGMGFALTFVCVIAGLFSWAIGLLYTRLNDAFGVDLSFMATVVNILVIACLVQLVELIIKKFFPGLYKALGIFLPLITTNCAVLGVAVINVQKEYNVLQGTVNGFATALGFTISIVLMAGLREKMEYNDVPKYFQGFPIVLLTAGLMAIAFFGFSGVI